MMRFLRLPPLWLAVMLLAPAVGLAAEHGPVQRDHIEVELVAELDAIQPGQTFRAGVRMLPDDNWHTYWKNSGDSGLPTTLEWALPEGLSASGIEWPYPEAVEMGQLVNYGYKDEHLLPVTITVPEDLSSGQDLTLIVDAAWLVCEVECIPGDASLALDLPVVDDSPGASNHTDLFAWAEQRQPVEVDWPARFSTDGGSLSLQVEPEERSAEGQWDFFAATENVVEHSQHPSIAADNGLVLVSQPISPYMGSAPDKLSFVLVDTDDGQAYELTARAGELESLTVLTEAGATGWALALVLALLGGVLLNLMPCVFPVLSIKAMSLVAGSGHDQRGHGLAYTAGILVSFALLAAVLLGLRAGGEAIGWGFQLQSPLFVGVLVYVFFALGLSLSGLFDFGTRLMGVGQGLTEKRGLKGSFFTGVLACVVASPCTAPFMGTALGAAVLMPWPMAMTVFLALALGLALPMLLLSFSPALASRMPAPGPWMETFKQAMAFPIYLAVVWLLWVLARQTDPNGLAAILLGMVALAFALWLGRLRDGRPVLAVARHVTVAACLVITLAALGAATGFQEDQEQDVQAWWEPYSEETLQELRDDPDRAVLVNMTADWCVTCLVNERVALNTDTVRQAMDDNDVTYVKGDWTRRDSAITEYLSEYGRNGVPLYVLYPRNGDDPEVLPQVLTPGIVVKALEGV